MQRSQESYDRHEEATWELVDAWLDHQVFSWQWWFNVGLTIIPWLVWAWLRPRGSTDRLLYVGFYYIILSCFLDFFGVSYGFWRYHVEVIPSIPSYIPWDFTMYPVAGMLLLQYQPRLTPYLKALLFACAASLAVEPLFTWMMMYEPVNWSVFLSLPIHYVSYLGGHWFSTRSGFAPLVKEPVPPWNPPT